MITNKIFSVCREGERCFYFAAQANNYILYEYVMIGNLLTTTTGCDKIIIYALQNM